MKTENRSRRAKLNLVTSVRRMLIEKGLTEDEVVGQIAKKCGCSPETVRGWLPSAGKKRRPPKGKNYDRIKDFNESLAGSKGMRKVPVRPRFIVGKRRRSNGSITITLEGDGAERLFQLLLKLLES